jgi:FdhD protein
VRTMLEVEITRIDVSKGERKRTRDLVAEEKPVYVFLNKSHYATILCTPSNLKELAVGHVLSEGIATSIDEINKIEMNEEEGSCRIRLKETVDLEKRLSLAKRFARVFISACGTTELYAPVPRLKKIRSTVEVRAETILDCVRRLNSVAETYRKTGGVHVAAIYRNNGLLVASAEDVGRHNAVDKAIGAVSLHKTRFDQCFLALSGRLTSDIVFKAARMRLPVVVSLSAAIDSGIDLAREVNLTLVGFARGRHMNVYTSPKRILT